MSTPPPGAVILRLSADGRAPMEAWAVGPVLTIGRAKTADFFIPGARFSLQHAHLVWHDETYVLEAHPNKTRDSDPILVDGRPIIGRVPLTIGSAFHIGGVTFEVVILGRGVTANMGTAGAVAGAPVGGNESMVQFGRGDGLATRNLGSNEGARNWKKWAKSHWPSLVALVVLVVGGAVWMATRPPPPPPPPPPVAVDLCDIPYRPSGLEVACSSPDDCETKALAAVARAKRKAETGARGYEIMTEAMSAIRLADQAQRPVQIDKAREYLDLHFKQLLRLCRSARLDVTQAARAGHKSKAFRACRNLLDAIPDPGDPRYVWARKCMIDFGED